MVKWCGSLQKVQVVDDKLIITEEGPKYHCIYSLKYPAMVILYLLCDAMHYFPCSQAFVFHFKYFKMLKFLTLIFAEVKG